MTWLIVRQQLLNPFLVGVAGVQKHLTFLTPRLKWMETNVAAVVLYSGEGVCFLSRQEVQKKKKSMWSLLFRVHTHTHTNSHSHSGWQRNWVKCSLPWGGHCVFHRTSIHTQRTTGKTCGHVWEEACGNRRRGRETSWLDRSIRWKIVSIWSISPLYLPSFFSSILSLILSSLPLLEFSSPFPPQNSLPSSCSCFAQLIWRLTIFPWPVLFSITLRRIFFFLFVCFSIIVPFCYCGALLSAEVDGSLCSSVTVGCHCFCSVTFTYYVSFFPVYNFLLSPSLYCLFMLKCSRFSFLHTPPLIHISLYHSHWLLHSFPNSRFCQTSLTFTCLSLTFSKSRSPLSFCQQTFTFTLNIWHSLALKHLSFFFVQYWFKF